MGSRRGATGLEGVLVIDKPEGLTSHDVVAAVRRATGEGRVGHAGTLDPAATGVLVVLVGPYTRLEPFLSAASKSYEATITFGTATDTDDAEGAMIAESAIPSDVDDPAAARNAVAALLGLHMQRPPAYSAIKRGGEVAYRAARAGTPLEIAPRPIEVLDAQLVAIDATAHAWTVALTVSKGTYIRAIARDLGESLGTHAHLSALRRTASGNLTVDAALSLDDVVAAGIAGTVSTRFADPFAALGLPVVHATPSIVTDGRAMSGGSLHPIGGLVAVEVGGRLAAIYRASGETLVPEAVFPGGQR